MIFSITACESPLLIRHDPVEREGRKWGKNEALGILFDKKEYLVGCGHCSICEKERLERKRSKWLSRLIGMLREFKDDGCVTFNRGKHKRLKGSTYFMTLTVSNRKYPGCETKDQSRLPNYIIKRLNRSLDFRRESYFVLKVWLQRLLKNCNYQRDGVKYVLFPEWGTDTKGTNRLHVHCFFFIDSRVHGGDWCREFLRKWRELTLTTEGEFRAVADDITAAFYASKYATKVPANHRVMSSQFNWAEYEKKFILDTHGLPCDILDAESESGYYKWQFGGGDKQWRVVEENVPVEVLANKGLTLPEALRAYMDGLSVKGALVLDKPTHSIYKGGYVRCVVKDDYTLRETLASTPALPAGCSRMTLPCYLSLERGRLTRVLEGIKQRFQLPIRTLVVVLGSFPPSLCVPALLYKVFAQVSKRSRTRSIRFTPLHQF